MFGYVGINKPELKMKDFYKYKAYYCGLCRTLKERYGRFGQMTLSYDMTFLILLLTSLYESETKREQKRCIIHPVKKHDMLHNEITDYVADMNIVLTYNHFIDDWKDDKSVAALMGSKLFQRAYKKILKRYPKQCKEINESLERLAECEKNGEQNIDAVSRCFGDLMSALFVYHEDNWERILKNTGFYLGKYIYILDAYDDIEKDIKNGSFNPLIPLHQKETFDTEVRNMLMLMISECTREFEKLPCILNADILRNILYEGVWTKFEIIYNKRNKEEGKTYDSKSL